MSIWLEYYYPLDRYQTYRREADQHRLAHAGRENTVNSKPFTVDGYLFIAQHLIGTIHHLLLPKRKEKAMKTQMKFTLLNIFLAGLLAFGLAFGPVHPAQAAGCSVTSALDDGSAGTLRALLGEPNCDPITFDNDYTIHLASTLTLSRNVTIDGGTHNVVISGDTNDDGSGDVELFIVNPGVSAALNHLTVTKGKGLAGIRNWGTLTVTSSIFSDNIGVGTSNSGGAILNASGAHLTVSESTFVDNSTGADGGGIANYDSTVMVTDSTFSGNSATSGGAIYNLLGSVTISNSTLSANQASQGGGIFNYWGTLTVTNSTFSGNSATSGGGIYNNGPTTVTNSTFSGNSASSGGGIYNSDTAIFYNSIIANSTGGNCNSYVGDYNSRYLYNLADDASCHYDLWVFRNLSTLRLGVLGNYGGSTQTIPLLSGSYAIDKGYHATCPATDQRGVARPQGARCDVGAYESRGFSITRTGGYLQSAAVNSAFPNPLQVSLRETGGSLLPGGLVTFSGPATGASTNPVSFTAAADANGVTQAIATANSLPGAYIVNASAGGSNTLEFFLTNTKAETVTSLVSSLNPSNYGEAVTFTATVTAASGVPTGTVTFFENVPVGSQKNAQTAGADSTSNVVTLDSSGTATFTTSALSAGLHSMVAVYSGDASYNGSTSNTIGQVVNQVPAVIGQPANQAVAVGSPASFSAAASGYPTPTVQWQVSVDSAASWANIEGANTLPLIITASFSLNGYQYRAVFSNAAGSATSNAATLTVQQPPAITQQPQNATVNAGQAVTFTAAASGSPAPGVQWQVSSDTGATWTNINGATTATLTFNASLSQNGNQYHAVFTNAAGIATSQAASLTVNAVAGTGSIAGKLFKDANGNAKLDRGEAALAGWTMQLLNPADGSLIVTAQTDASGNYKFSLLSAGSYRLRLVLQPTYVQTSANPADISLANGQAVTGVNFGAVVSADLKVSMTAAYNSTTKIITYTITVNNDGPANAAAVSLKDTLSRYVSFVSANSTVGSCSNKSGTVTCTLGNLASGRSATITLTVNRTSTRYAIVNTATVSSSTFDIDKADNSVKVTVP